MEGMHTHTYTRALTFRGLFLMTAAAFSLFALFAIAPEAHAQTAFEQFGQATRLGDEPLPIVIARIIRGFISVLGIIAVLVILYGGFIWMTAGGNEDRINKAKATLRNGAIGLVIILASFSIATFIIGVLRGEGPTGGAVVDIADKYGEPLAGSLGVGIIQDHYPPRNALDIARNAKVFVTFKEPVDPTSIANGYDDAERTGSLNTDAVEISFPSTDADVTLGEEDVDVAFTEDLQTLVLDPVELMGDGVNDVNYTVFLTPNIALEDGSDAFAGAYAGGYEWTFEVGTEVDLTPPVITSVVPISDDGDPFARNTTIQVNFNEAMDPIRASGVRRGLEESYANIETAEDANEDGVIDDGEAVVDGEYVLVNGYRTVEFTTFDACGEDPCGNLIFCLPEGPLDLAVRVRAGSINPDEAPQVTLTNDGLADASGNSLDGGQIGGNGEAEGPPDDDFLWSFSVNDEIDTTVPSITNISPGIESEFVDPDAPVELTFNIPLKASTVNGGNIQLWPEVLEDYSVWSNPRLENGTLVRIFHPSLVSDADGGWDYYPLVNNGVRGANQICMHPGQGPSAPVGGAESDTASGSCDSTSALPYCCNGQPSENRCSTIDEGVELPYQP